MFIAATRFALDPQKRTSLARCHETNFARGANASASAAAVCGAVDVVAAVDRLSVISVVVAVAVCRLQRRRASAHAVADLKQELESGVENKTRCRTWPDSDNMKRVL